MKKTATVLIFLLLAGCSAAVSKKENSLYPTKPVIYRAAIAALMRDAANSDCIGRYVGYSLRQSDFDRVLEKVQPIATADDCRQMVQDPNVYVRLMGLMILEGKFPAEAKPVFESRVGSWAEFTSYSGCIGSRRTEGGYAGGWLYKDLTAAQRFEHDMMSMASNQVGFANCSGDLGIYFEKKNFPYQLEKLRAMCPHSSDMMIIKAVGRLDMRQPEEKRAFLIYCLETANVSDEARFAAASALTRTPDIESGAALMRSQSRLDQIDDRKLGTRFVDEWKLRVAYKTIMYVDWNDQERWRELSQQTHPMFVWELREMWSSAEISEANRRFSDAITTSLLAMAENLGEYQSPWDTYDDAAYCMLTALRFDSTMWDMGVGDDLIYKGSYNRLRNKLRPALIKWEPGFDIAVPPATSDSLSKPWVNE